MSTGRTDSLLPIALSFLAGALLGAGLALLFAPESGRKTRKKIKGFAEDVLEKAEDSLEGIKEKVDLATQKGKRLFRA